MSENSNNKNQKASNQNKKVDIEDLLKLKEECLNRIKDEELYLIRNDAKIRAVYTSQNYDEFK